MLILLLWLYFDAHVLLFVARFTRTHASALARRRGAIEPNAMRSWSMPRCRAHILSAASKQIPAMFNRCGDPDCVSIEHIVGVGPTGDHLSMMRETSGTRVREPLDRLQDERATGPL